MQTIPPQILLKRPSAPGARICWTCYLRGPVLLVCRTIIRHIGQSLGFGVGTRVFDDLLEQHVRVKEEQGDFIVSGREVAGHGLQPSIPVCDQGFEARARPRCQIHRGEVGDEEVAGACLVELGQC